MEQSILVVEDDSDIAELMQMNLQEITREITVVDTGEAAIDLFKQQSFDIIILDITLPGINGFDVCRMMRQDKPEQSILMVTSKTSEVDRVLGLELGADDYITKPFSIRELQARIRAQLRKAELFNQRQASKPLGIVCIGAMVIDPTSHQLMIDQQPVEVTSTEFDLMYHLAQHPNQVFSRQQLLDSVWGYKHSGYEHTVNSHINRLRCKLQRKKEDTQIIETVWGVGYKFNPQGVSL